MSALPHPPVPVGRGPLRGPDLKAPAEPGQQKSQAGARAGAGRPARHGQRRKDRTAHARAGPATSLIAVHDLPPAQPARRPSVILIAGYDPPDRALLPPAGRPAARPLPSGRRPLPSGRRPLPSGRRPCCPPVRACRPAARPCSPAGAAQRLPAGCSPMREKYLKRYANIISACNAENIFPAFFPHFSRTRGQRISSARDNRRRAGR